MKNYWPPGLNAKDFSPEDRQAIKIWEAIRQLEESLAKLEGKQT